MACLVGVLTLGCVRPTVRPQKQKAQFKLEALREASVSFEDGASSESCAAAAKGRPKRTIPPAPLSIFHALHCSFEALRRELPRLAAEGYDAVQLPPAQRSQKGDLRKEWFFRYQPLRYGEIDPLLGGEAGLCMLCRDAAELGIMVIADCVFNHMAVVACRREWEAAQVNARLMEELMSRLDRTFGPELNRFDFQWPWVCLEGSKWDDPQFKYEGWGCGEWSELKWSPRVLEVHYNHLRTLLRCGVRGFRIDAAKHMRPQHVRCYVDFLQQSGAFVYVEVLSLQRDEHIQYEVLGNGTHVLSTDYLSASHLCGAVRNADPAALLPRLLPLAWPATEAVRFVRNHDTVLNEESICGIDWRSAEEAQAAWAYLLSLPGGCALVYSEDRALPAVRRAVAFRRLVAQRARGEHEKKDAKAKAGQGSCVRAQVTAWPPPHYSLLLAMPMGPKGEPLGIVAVNFSRHEATSLQLPLHLQGLAMTEVLGGQRCNGVWHPHLSAPFTVPDLLPVVIQPNDARFFVVAEASPIMQRSAVQTFTLLYFSGWDRPHLHFGIRGHWTRAPGWPLLASPPPPVGLGAQALGGGGKRHGRWWRVDVPLPGPACATEFVLNDGGAVGEEATCWDKNPYQQNYVIPGAGTYILDDGRLMRLGGSA